MLNYKFNKSSDYLNLLLKALLDLKKTTNKFGGICINVGSYVGSNIPSSVEYDLLYDCNINLRNSIECILSSIFDEWPKFTGSRAFPVPHPNDNPMDGFQNNFNKWEGEYGQNRMELLDFCIASLKLALETKD